MVTDQPATANSLTESAGGAHVGRRNFSRALTPVPGTGVAEVSDVVDSISNEVERWYTVREAALLCHRAEGTIRNLLSKHKLPRRLARGPGRRPRRIALLSASTIRTLQRLTLGV